MKFLCVPCDSPMKLQTVGLRRPLLVSAAVAVPQLDLGAVGRTVAVDVQASAEGTQRLDA